MNDVERYRAEFEAMGEARVREQYERGAFDTFKLGVAHHWLAELDRGREASSKAASNASERAAASAARSQVDLACEANRIAKINNRIAAAALVIAMIAMIVSIVTALRG